MCYLVLLVPSPIGKFKALIESTSIKLTWSRPRYPNGILRYKVLSKVQNGDEKRLEEALSAEQFEFKELQEFYNYTFTIIPYTGGGAAPRQSINLTTDSAGIVYFFVAIVALNCSSLNLLYQISCIMSPQIPSYCRCFIINLYSIKAQYGCIFLN